MRPVQRGRPLVGGLDRQLDVADAALPQRGDAPAQQLAAQPAPPPGRQHPDESHVAGSLADRLLGIGDLDPTERDEAGTQLRLAVAMDPGSSLYRAALARLGPQAAKGPRRATEDLEASTTSDDDPA